MDIIITKELLTKLNACPKGPNFFTENNLWDKPESEVLAAMRLANMAAEEEWWNHIKQTPAFKVFTSEVQIMGTYQVFNPITGVHTRYQTEAEAKEALVIVAKEVIKNYCQPVVQEVYNENGDTTWIPTTLHQTLEIS